jgi:hypothetical protein
VARTLYRIYLYIFTAVLIIFAASVLGIFLGTVFQFTPLRLDFETPPDVNQLKQMTTLLVIALVVALALGGLHYWLIRRDIAQDPDAARGPVRALVLNALQAGAALFALFSGIAIVGPIALGTVSGTASGLATLIPAVVVFALVQLERGRARPAPGAALALQRLHVYFIQTVTLLTALYSLYTAVSTSVQALFVALGLTTRNCNRAVALFPTYCDLGIQLRTAWFTVLWIVVVWAVYLWLGQGDGRSVLRQFAQYFGFLVGIGFVIFGTERAAELVLRAALQVLVVTPDVLISQFDFITPIIVGLILLVGYGAALMSHAADAPLGRTGTETALLALSGATLALPFYIGVILLLEGALEQVVPDGHPPDNSLWAIYGAILISGLAHPLVAYVLRLRGAAAALAGPRRAYTFALLAGGALTATLTGITLIYVLVTAALGTPVEIEWQPLARVDAVVFAVSAFVAGVQLWRLIAERGPAGAKPAVVPSPAPAPAAAASTPAPAPSAPPPADEVAAVVDALLAGRLTRDQAIAALQRAIHSS